MLKNLKTKRAINNFYLKQNICTKKPGKPRLFGGQCWTRTSDPLHVTEMLYQLS